MVVNVVNENKEFTIAPLWQMPFRPFFICASVYSSIALLLWVVSYVLHIPLGGVGYMWHIHEMIMGFAATTMVGFVLTASQTWTGVPSVRGNPLIGLFALWLTVRVIWLMPSHIQWVAGWLEMLFFFFVAFAFGRQILMAKNWRNAFLIAVFVALGLLNGAYALSLEHGDHDFAKKLLMVAFFLIAHVVLVIGGRVIPFFSDRGLKRPSTNKPVWIELSALISSLLFLVVYLGGLSQGLVQQVCWAVVIFNSIRWLSWKPWQTAGVPILWSLHVAYGCMIAGFVLMGLGIASSAALHMMAIGGFGLMILAMISRVSLGHSGRPLVLPKYFGVAYLGVILAAVARVFATLMPEYYVEFLWVALLGWCVGFGLFMLHYLPILWSARVDGRPG